MSRADPSVATNHYPWLLVENLDIRFGHRTTNDPCATVANDLHVEIHGRNIFAGRDLSHRFEFVIRMRAATDYRDVTRAANVCDSARDIHWIVVTTTWN